MKSRFRALTKQSSRVSMEPKTIRLLQSSPEVSLVYLIGEIVQKTRDTFVVFISDAPDFYDKPKIVQKDKDDKQNVQIKIRAKSHLEMKEQWYKVGFTLKKVS